MLEDVVFADVVGKVVGFPVGAIRRTMPLNHAIAVGYTGIRNAGADDPKSGRILKIPRCINVEATSRVATASLEVGFIGGQFENVMVERGHGGCSEKPVRSDKRDSRRRD